MKKKSCVTSLVWARALIATSAVVLVACAGRGTSDADGMAVNTPTVDYIEQLDVYTAPHKDSFLNQLAMNYRSYAIYNARTSNYPDMGELFAQKAIAAFSGEIPYPESLDNWAVESEQEAFELYTAYNNLVNLLNNDIIQTNPRLAAEAQAKYDCWLSAKSTGQTGTANECRDRFNKTMAALQEGEFGVIVEEQSTITSNADEVTVQVQQQNASNRPVDYYPDTRSLSSVNGQAKAREGVIIVNNVNVPEHLIKPEPVRPLVFNQTIYGVKKNNNNSVTSNTSATSKCQQYDPATGKCSKFVIMPIKVNNNTTNIMAVDGHEHNTNVGQMPGNSTEFVDNPNGQDFVDETVQSKEQIPMLYEELVTRDEFINMMMAMRAELAAINSRLDKIQAASGDKTMIKVQQIPLEPKQHVMEEILEVRFDFNKSVIKPEYKELIEKLATATQANKNIKVSVVGHTDTTGSKNYNYALGGRRAEAVQKMLIEYGIPASQIVAVSAGEEGLAVPTGDNVANADNRRVRVVKEVHYTEMEPAGGVAIQVQDAAVKSTGLNGNSEQYNITTDEIYMN